MHNPRTRGFGQNARLWRRWAVVRVLQVCHLVGSKALRHRSRDGNGAWRGSLLIHLPLSGNHVSVSQQRIVRHDIANASCTADVTAQELLGI